MEKNTEGPGEFIGEVGEKIIGLPVTGRLIMTTFNGRYTSYLYGFRDGGGNDIKWWSSKMQDGIKGGAEFKISGTVKGHEVYREKKQTIITRVKITF